MNEHIGLLLFQKYYAIEEHIREIVNRSLPSKINRINKTQALVFACIDNAGASDLTISDVAKKIGASRQTVHTAALALIALGLITLETSKKNKSAKNIVLTRSGKEVLKQARVLFESIERKIAGEIGEEEFTNLKKVLSADWKLLAST